MKYQSRYLAICLASVWSAICCTHVSTAAVVTESARDIPVVQDVDVVVVGGTTAGVAAAVKAAEAGASVFLAAPRPYLGEDLCATYRLWLEPDETPDSPLAKKLFDDPRRKRGIPFTYEADTPSADKHKDSSPPSKLCDGQWANAVSHSVQYDRDTAVICDFGKQRAFQKIRFVLFQSPNNFEVDSIAVAVSDDTSSWRSLGNFPNDRLGKGSFVYTFFEIEADVAANARYVRCAFKKGPKAQRMLLGEIQFVPKFDESQEAAKGLRVTTPMQVKQTLDDALLAANVPFLYSAFATDVLRDEEGRLAGIVIADRAGRQAIKAKVIVDATADASLARIAGVSFAPYAAGARQFRRVVIGGEARTGPGIKARRIPLRVPLGGRAPAHYGTGDWALKKNTLMAKSYDSLIEYALTIPMQDGSFPERAKAEQLARDLTFHPEQVDASEVLFEIPSDPVVGQTRARGPWPGAEQADLAWFRPEGMAGLYVLGGYADVSRTAAVKLLRPLEFIAMGQRIGAAAAVEAKTRTAPRHVRVAGAKGRAETPGDTKEFLYGLRVTRPVTNSVRAEARSIPVLGRYDVVVVGGGTSGGPAAIAAARQGARTLVVEYLHGLGGVATTGMIGIYCAGYRKGFTASTEKEIEQLGAASYIVGKMESWRREIRKAGGDVWFGVAGVGAFVDGKTVKGAVVATPEGRGVVLAKVVIDGTGNSDIAAAAGAECMFVGGDTVAMQGAGLPQYELGARYLNTDWTYVDETDMIDTWSAYVAAKRRYPGAFDLGQLIDTRERRRIVGDYVLTPLDIVNQRTFPDTIGMSNGGQLDTHGYTVHPYYTVNGWGGGITYTPYRCLLPKGLDGILVVGIGVSAQRDAQPSIRMQPCMQNLGYAAGVCAAQAAAGNCPTREIDIKAVQQHLVEKDCLVPGVLKQRDSFPLPDDRLRDAVRVLVEKDYSELKVLMARRDSAVPLLREAYGAPGISAEGKLRCAHVLALLGDATGVPTLIAKVAEYKTWDSEKISERHHPSNTWLDSYIFALGYARDKRATAPIVAKLSQLGQGKSGSRSSHYRAAALALEIIGDPSAAPALAEVLDRSHPTNDTVSVVDDQLARKRAKNGQIQLTLARALYRLGDCEGLGESVLKAYTQDLRGVYARHAGAVLDGK